MGILFDFTSPADEISIRPPTSILGETWFKELMDSRIGHETDIWLVAGHMPLDGPEDEWDELVEGMRRWNSVGQKPIVGLGEFKRLRGDDPRVVLMPSLLPHYRWPYPLEELQARVKYDSPAVRSLSRDSGIRLCRLS